MVASSNSIEVGVMGNSGDTWTQWVLADSARAELPLGADQQETFPIGCALDTGSTKPIPWGESTLPPAPKLLLLSHHGILCCFNVINLKQGLPTVCSPADPLPDISGANLFTKVEPPKSQPVLPTQTIKPEIKPQVTSTPQFGEQSNLIKPPPTSQTVFGGEVTITPVGQNGAQTQNKLYPNLPYQSLYPSLPSQDNSAPKSVTFTLPTSSPIFSGKPIVPKTATPQVLPIVSQPPIIKQTLTTPDASLVKQKESKPPVEDLPAVDLKAEEQAEEDFGQLIKDECVFLQSQLHAVLHEGRTLKIDLGPEAQKTNIVNDLTSLEEFFKELVEICGSQSNEVHVLKQNLLQSWTWYEDAQSRFSASRNEEIGVILRAQPLDSVSEKQLEDIRHANYYLESQIAQAHRALDEQWENFQDYCRKTHKIQIPTMEIIFQTLVKQNAIVQKQSYILKDIASRMRNKSRSALGPSLFSVKHLKEIEDDIQRLSFTSEDANQLQYNRVMTRMTALTSKKSGNLRCFLRKRDYPHITPVKPQFSDSILQVSPQGKLKQISLLGAKLSPVVRDTVTRKLDFVQSTPKPTVLKFEDPKNSMEGLQNFALKFNAGNFKSFAPLPGKSGIASSPNSAFVSTSFGAASASATPVTAISKPSSSFNVPFVTSSVTSTGQPVIEISSKPFNFSSFNVQNEPKPFSFGQKTTVPSLVPGSGGQQVSTSIFGGAKSVTTTNATFGAGNTLSVASSVPFSLSFGTGGTSTSIFGGTQNPEVTPTSLGNNKTFVFATNSSTKTVPTIKPTTATSGSGKTNVTQPLLFTSTPSLTITPKSGTIETSSTTAPPKLTGIAVQSTSSQLNISAVTKPLIFGVAPSTTISSTISSSDNVSSVTTTANVEGSVSKGSIFASSSTVLSPATPPSIFGAQSTTKSSSIFGQPPGSTTPQATFAPVSSSQSTVLGAALSKPSIFGGTATTTSGTSTLSSTGAVTTTSQSVVVTSTTTPKGSVFGTSTSTPQASSAFGTPTSTSQSSAFSTPVFGTTQATSLGTPTTTSQSLTFGTATPTSQTSVFGTPATTQTSVFATPVTTQIPVFSTPTTTPTTSVFGTPSTTQSVFGTATPTAVQTSVFATPTTTQATTGFSTSTTSQITAFASPAITQTSVFQTAVSQPSGFGTDSTTVSSAFGTPAVSQPASIFGAGSQPFGTASASQSAFGAVTSTQSTTFGGFGGTQNTSIFGSTTPTSTPQPSMFGNSSSQAPVFGATAPTSFGTPTNAASPPFGQTQGVFGAQSPTTAFGGGFSGTAPAFGQASGSIFGGTATTTSGASIFGATPTTSTAFGTSGSLFGTTVSTSSQPFGSGSVFASQAQSGPGSFGFGGLNVSTTSTGSNSGFGFGQSASNPFAAATQTQKSPFGGDSKSIFGSSASGSSASPFGGTSGSIFGSSSQVGTS